MNAAQFLECHVVINVPHWSITHMKAYTSCCGEVTLFVLLQGETELFNVQTPFSRSSIFSPLSVGGILEQRKEMTYFQMCPH